MAVLLILHVIALGLLFSRLPLRALTLLGLFVYFWGFYLVMGHRMANHREMITPAMPLEDDYYNFWRKKKVSPFQDQGDSSQKTDEETEDDLRRQKDKERGRMKKENPQPTTNP